MINNIPVIVVDGKEIKAGSPKARAWRELYGSGATFEDALDTMVDGIVLVFNREDVTADTVYNNVDLAEVPELYKKCIDYVVSIFTTAMENAPKNADGGVKK